MFLDDNGDGMEITMNKNIYDIIIIGSGTAGLTAAIYGARAGKRVLVLEAKVYGGQIIETAEIENYPGIKNVTGYEFAENLFNQATDLGVEIVFEQVTEVVLEDNLKKVVTDDNEYTGVTLIVASGLKKRKLGIEREEEFAGKGVSYCATCDGAFYRDKVTAVNGGGNTAVSEVLYLSDICSKVYLIHRRDTFRAEEGLVEKVKQRDNIEIVLNSEIIELAGENQLSEITVRDKESGGEKKLNVDGLFVCIGQLPQNDYLNGLVELDDYGYISAGEDCITSVKGIFAAGDCRTKNIRQLVTAASDGAVAAVQACELIRSDI